MSDVVLVCLQSGVSLDGIDTYFWPPEENPDPRILRLVHVGKLWDVLDYGLCCCAGSPRRESVLARGLGENFDRQLYTLSEADAEALFYGLSEIDMEALTEKSYELDDFRATPEEEGELDELRDELLALLLFYLDHPCDLYLER